ncbi:acetoacetate decarboxylase family protein [Rhodococcus koreensis]
MAVIAAISESGVPGVDIRPRFTFREALADLRRRDDPKRDKYRDAKFLSAVVPVDRDAANRWLPGGVRMGEDSTATIFVADYPWTNFNCVYREAAVFLNVKHGPFRAAHCPWIVVDNDAALIPGRDMLGFPKKIAEIEWAEDGEQVEAVVRRRGVELLRMSGGLGDPVESVQPIFNQPFRNVIGTVGLTLPRLVTFSTNDEPLEIRSARVSLKVGGSYTDPLDLLGFGDPLTGNFRRVNMRVGRIPMPVGLVSPTFLMRMHPLRAS